MGVCIESFGDFVGYNGSENHFALLVDKIEGRYPFDVVCGTDFGLLLSGRVKELHSAEVIL